MSRRLHRCALVAMSFQPFELVSHPAATGTSRFAYWENSLTSQPDWFGSSFLHAQMTDELADFTVLPRVVMAGAELRLWCHVDFRGSWHRDALVAHQPAHSSQR